MERKRKILIVLALSGLFTVAVLILWWAYSRTNINKEDPDINQQYYSQEDYCEQDSDCVLRPNCCNSCHRDYVNTYHQKQLTIEECPIEVCTMDCPSPESYSQPICEKNKCSPSDSKNTSERLQ